MVSRRSKRPFKQHTKVCSDCKEEKPILEFRNQNGTEVNRCMPCRFTPTYKFKDPRFGDEDERKRQKRRNYVKALRQRVLDHYGAACQCCGENEPVFLTIDHVNDDGHADRKTGIRGSTHLYHYIIRNNFPDRFRILCFNCNRGRYLNGGTCPHDQYWLV